MIKRISLLCSTALLCLHTSCGRFVDGYEISPNEPIAVTNQLLLTGIEVSTFSAYSGQLARLASILVQQQAGTDFQFEAIARYQILAGDNLNEWEQIYANSLINSQTLIKQLGDNRRHYRGIAKILMAMNLGLATDFWGDVPFTEALGGLEGEARFNPSYERQEAILGHIQRLLDEALQDLNTSPADPSFNIEVPAEDDLIFGGDSQKWAVTAHILKARYANRLSKRDPSGSASAALNHLANARTAGLSSSASDCKARFGVNGNELNQWYAFNLNRAGYMQMGKIFVDTLLALNDPRLPFYASLDDDGNYSGTPLNSRLTSSSVVGSYFSSPAAPAPMVTYVEARFIEAEAALRSGNTNLAADAYNEAVLSHIAEVTGSSAPMSYIAAYASETGSTISLEKIMLQKYLAMFTQAEVWADWRRTNLPSLSPDPRATSNAIPRRLPTPQSEINYNRSAINITNIYQPVWWDE